MNLRRVAFWVADGFVLAGLASIVYAGYLIAGSPAGFALLGVVLVWLGFATDNWARGETNE